MIVAKVVMSFVDQLPEACLFATSPMISASSFGRDHIGQWLVGKVDQVTFSANVWVVSAINSSSFADLRSPG